jgi:hypothetical protein
MTRRVGPQDTQVTKCPHGIQARLFFAVRHITHGFAGDGSFV